MLLDIPAVAISLILSIVLSNSSSGVGHFQADAKAKEPVLKVAERHRFNRVPGFFAGNLAFNQKGNLLVTHEKGAIVVWDLALGMEKNRIPCDGSTGVFLSPDERFVTTFIDRDFPGGGTIKRFEIATGKENGSFPLKEKEHFVNISADGKTFLTYSDGIIQIRGMTPFPMRREFRIYPDRVAVWGPGFALSPDSSLLAHEDSQTKTIKIWRIPTGEVMHSLDCPEKKIRGFASSRLAFSRSGKFLACASADKSVRIWNAQSGEMLQKIVTPDRPLRLAFSPNEQWLAIGSVDAKSRLSIRETATWKEIASWEPELYNSRTIAFSPSGNLLASTGGRSYQVWEISKIGRPDPKTPDKTR